MDSVFVAKLLHFVGGYALAMTVQTVHIKPLGMPWKPLPAIASALTVGVLKEVYDGIHDRPRESMSSHTRDVVITTGGGLLAVGVHLTFR